MATRNWELEHGPETSVSSATLDFLTEDDARGETADDDDDVDNDEDHSRKLMKNSSAVSGLTAAGLGTYMPKYSSDYSSMDNLLTAAGGFPGTPETEHDVQRPASPPMRHRYDNDDLDEDDSDLSIRPMDGGSGWSSSTVAADILF